MKYVPLLNYPNISESRLESISPSLKISSINNPHVCWLDKGNDINVVNYSYWDGTKWAYKDIPKVYISNEDIVSSPSSLVLDNDDPIIAFSRKYVGGSNISRLSLATYDNTNTKWNFNDLDVDYEVGWIGVTKQDRGVEYSSSSSSQSDGFYCCSEKYTNNPIASGFSNWVLNGLNTGNDSGCRVFIQLANFSGTQVVYIRDISNNQLAVGVRVGAGTITITPLFSSGVYGTVNWDGVVAFTSGVPIELFCSEVSSSSSSLTSYSLSLSSSSSTSYSLSHSSSSSSSVLLSSSSSMNDASYFVTVYDITNSLFKVYSVSDVWRLMGSKSAILTNYSSIRVGSSGDNISIAYLDDTSIQYDFFDLYLEQWKFGSFTTLTPSTLYGDIIDMDMVGYNIEDDARCSVVWSSNTSSYSYLNGAICSEDGSFWEIDSSSYNIESSSIDVVASDSNYVINGYKKVGVSINNGLTNIFATGSNSKLFSLTLGNTWTENLIDIEGISNGIVTSDIRTEYNSGVKVVLASDSGDIYYFEPSVNSSFPLSTPEVVFISQKSGYKANYSLGLLSGDNILDMYDNVAGDILRDGKGPLLITSNKITPP